MLLLLAAPIILTVTFAHRLLRTVAPSNIMISRVRATSPTLLRAGGVAALALALAALAHRLAIAIAGGAAGWLNLVVLVLLWDAIKLMLVALLVAVRSGVDVFHRAGRRIAPFASSEAMGAACWNRPGVCALGTHKDEKRRPTLEKVGRRFRRSDARFRHLLAGQGDPGIRCRSTG